MNKILGTLLLLLFCLSAQSQVQTIFFDAKDKVTRDSTLAASYGIYGKVTGSSLYVFKKYDIEGNLMTTGAFADEALALPQGKFIYYDWVDPNKDYRNYSVLERGKERFVVLTGNFEKGLRQGQWTSYYEDGNVKTVSFYEAGVLKGMFKSFNRKGELMESGQFVNNMREGKWLFNGGLNEVEFKEDKIISQTQKTRRQLKAAQE